MTLLQLILGFILFVLGLGYLFQPQLIMRFNAFVRDTSPDVVSIAAFAVINIVTRRGRGVFQQPLQQRNLLVALAPEDVAELMRHRQRAQ